MTATYVAGKGIYVTFPGITILLPELTVAALETYLRELRELYG